MLEAFRQAEERERIATEGHTDPGLAEKEMRLEMQEKEAVYYTALEKAELWKTQCVDDARIYNVERELGLAAMSSSDFYDKQRDEKDSILAEVVQARDEWEEVKMRMAKAGFLPYIAYGASEFSYLEDNGHYEAHPQRRMARVDRKMVEKWLDGVLSEAAQAGVSDM